jgi:hypothetical protein
VTTKRLAIAAFAASIGGIGTAAQALDIAPSTPSTQISETLPPVQGDPSVPVTPPEGFSNTHPIAGHRGYVFVAPAWRRTTDRNATTDPAAGADAQGDSVPTGESPRQPDANRQ